MDPAPEMYLDEPEDPMGGPAPRRLAVAEGLVERGWYERLEVVDHPAEEHHRDGEEGQEGPHQVHLQAQQDHGTPESEWVESLTWCAAS